MKLFLTTAIVVLQIVTTVNAQDLINKKYTWESDPKIHTLTASEQESSYITLKEKTIYEYVYEASGDLVVYETAHIITHINTDAGIEEMNKIYIPYRNILEEIDLKARTITPDGKISYLNKSNVKKVDNLENAGPYLIFAMEGVVKGSEIEYIITNKKTPSINFIERMQDKKPKKDISFDIYSPINLVFEARGYNGFPDAKIDTTLKEKQHIMVAVDKIDATPDEKYSFTSAIQQRLDVQLTYNTLKGKARLSTWESMGRDLHNGLFNCTKAELKVINKLISKLGIEKEKTDTDKLLKLEQWMKVNIEMKESTDNTDIDKMLDNKYGSEQALVKLYIASAQLLNLPVELVLVSERPKRKFDVTFPSYNSLQEYLIYYPSCAKYLSPGNYYSRIGFPPPALMGDKGLFIKETSVGDIKAAVSKIKPIESINYIQSNNDIDAIVNFDNITLIPTINYKHSYSGYTAYFTQPQIPYMNDEQKKTFMEDIAKVTGKESIVKSVKMDGTAQSDVMVTPLIITTELEAANLVENTGKKILFKVGTLIGPQDELYQKEERKLDGELLYAHSFNRNLTINIPKGYKVLNANDIKIDKLCDENGKKIALFTSDYTIEGDIIKIKVTEQYRELFFSKQNYEAYRSVINAAADFNKIILIFEKL